MDSWPLEFWQCLFCGGRHPTEVYECPYGYTDLDQEDEQTQA